MNTIYVKTSKEDNQQVIDSRIQIIDFTSSNENQALKISLVQPRFL